MADATVDLTQHVLFSRRCACFFDLVPQRPPERTGRGDDRRGTPNDTNMSIPLIEIEDGVRRGASGLWMGHAKRSHLQRMLIRLLLMLGAATPLLSSWRWCWGLVRST